MVSKQVGISADVFHKIIRGDMAPAERIAELVRFGIPRDLLPPASPGRGGRRNGNGDKGQPDACSGESKISGQDGTEKPGEDFRAA
jgi:hypothetical protein